jgi:hypothetical protein
MTDTPLLADPVPALIAWFTANRSRLPQAPFNINRGITVTDPALFYAGLDETCAAYPNGPRAKVLQGVLEALKEKYDAAK